MHSLSPEILLRAEDIFKSKNWEIKGGVRLNLFDKFCERLRLFNKSQQELLLELTKSFTKIGMGEYLECFLESFFCLPQSVVEKKIYLYPLIDPIIKTSTNTKSGKLPNYIEKGKTKSANFLHYMIESNDIYWVSDNIIVNNSFSLLKKEFEHGKCVLILVDDYVGSGKTAVDACATFLTLPNIQPSDIKIVCLAAHNHGIKHVKEKLGIDVFSDIQLFKGISENIGIDNINIALELMEGMEKTLKCNEKYRFGYEKTESLITFMNKTPNNTFPVYWHETPTKVAPFPRYNNYKGNGK